ncbi:hypothetical protein F5B19DRAFT_475279 [Rostrohypoxylon terebratum]|nr:hypothetical protein F5B19DRAFT_475279 [Rostrohypoxylon terebratum]
MFKRFRSRNATDSDYVESNIERSSSRIRDLLGKSFTINSDSNRRSPSPSPSGLGLHVIHQPEVACIDIIFVHGLGGHSQRTWSRNHDPTLFWPKLWLPLEPGIGKARIMTFGYNADWRGATKSIANVTDFAKELLFEMRFSIDEDGLSLNIGKNPVIFVVHSMGGLVVKKAYLLGLHDENYRNVVRSISAIMFLSTPHRGTNLASTLNRVLAASFQSPKNFISDLNKGSSTIEELNEQFRHVVSSLSIWSFYETIPTAIGPKKIMVLEKESSILGYPGEISRPLQADHHDVCKYSSPLDPNYVSVRNALKFLVAQFRQIGAQEIETNSYKTTSTFQELFRDSPTTEDDYNALNRIWIPNTCMWFLNEPETVSWLESTPEHRILWFNAPPGSGKSVLSAFMINHLRNSGLKCQFFLFKYSDQNKRSVIGCLQSLALQISQGLSEFKTSLDGFSTENLSFDSGDPFLVWRNIFEGALFDIERTTPIYWVIDALDESDSPKSLLKCLASLPKARVPIRILIISRHTDSIAIQMDRLSEEVPLFRIEKTDDDYNYRDIELLAKQELKHMRGSLEFREQLMDTVLKRSEGNFLWARLALDELLECHTEENIRNVLQEIPDNMTQVYDRMEDSLLRSVKKPNKELIRAFLEWCTCAQRPLSLLELSQALQPRFRGFLDLKRTIEDICGQFIQVEENGGVSMIHHTAREYFMNSSKNFLIDAQQTHEMLFMDTLTVIEDSNLRWRLSEGEHALQSSEPFIFYSAVNWPFHLDQSSSTSSKCLDQLVKFFRSNAVLTWIHTLALLRRLEVLVRASKAITSLVHKMKRQSSSDASTLDRFRDLEFLDNWVVDLTKIVGRFAQNIIPKPRVLYDVIPSLCPTDSAVHRQFSHSTKMKVLGNLDTSWNDHLCRMILPREVEAWSIKCAGKHVAVLDSVGIIHVWDSSSFSLVTSISHGEPVTAMALNGTGTQLSTCGLKTTKMWIIPSGNLLASTENPLNIKALTITYARKDRELLLGSDDNIIRHIQCDSFEGGWQILNPCLLKDVSRHEGAIVSSPLRVAFNRDMTHVAVSYRGAPLSVWRLHDGRCINKCKRVQDLRQPSSNWFAVNRVTWNPVTNHVLGIYKDGRVFKWHPMTDENTEGESRWAADEIAASPNGRLFVTSSSNGSVCLWDFAHLTVIYQVLSENLVTELSFSPDNRRFYDLRNGTVNVWEPNSLARFLESDESTSDTGSIYQSSTAPTIPVESRSRLEVVTAFALNPNGNLYCVGYEDGIATLFQKGKTDGIELSHFRNFLPVEHIIWSKNGRYVAVADLAGDIQVKSVDEDGSKNVLIRSLPTPHLKLNTYNIEQIVLSHDGQNLFILAGEEGFTYSTKDGALITKSESSQKNGKRKWLCHPTNEDVILAYGTSDIGAYTWTDIKNFCSIPYHEVHHSPSFETGEKDTIIKASSTTDQDSLVEKVVKNVIISPDKSHILVHIWTRLGDDIAIIRIANLPENNGKTRMSSLKVSNLPVEISSQIHVLLGVIHGSNLIFLDHHFWLCSYSIDTPEELRLSEAYNRLYFIPRGWVGQHSVAGCVLTEDGSLFWPRDDGVVIIECNLYDTSLALVS